MKDAIVNKIPGFLTLLVVIAFLTKLVRAGMSARGAVELIIADIALQAGLFEVPAGEHPIVQNLLSVVVIMAVVTTLLTPVALRVFLSRYQNGDQGG